eukprot:SAG31_NODE_2545_length_5532_cov_4.104546_1_plen_452_part_00
MPTCPICRAPFDVNALHINVRLAKFLAETAASSDAQSDAQKDGQGSKFECCICLETLKQPATLPCGHDGCLPCLRQLRSRSDSEDGDTTSSDGETLALLDELSSEFPIEFLSDSESDLELDVDALELQRLRFLGSAMVRTQSNHRRRSASPSVSPDPRSRSSSSAEVDRSPRRLQLVLEDHSASPSAALVLLYDDESLVLSCGTVSVAQGLAVVQRVLLGAGWSWYVLLQHVVLPISVQRSECCPFQCLGSRRDPVSGAIARNPILILPAAVARLAWHCAVPAAYMFFVLPDILPIVPEADYRAISNGWLAASVARILLVLQMFKIVATLVCVGRSPGTFVAPVTIVTGVAESSFWNSASSLIRDGMPVPLALQVGCWVFQPEIAVLRALSTQRCCWCCFSRQSYSSARSIATRMSEAGQRDEIARSNFCQNFLELEQGALTSASSSSIEL